MTADTLFADRYRLEHRLGVGGMATVQLAMDTRLERHVAVKLLAEHLARGRELRLALQARGARRRAARAPEHRPGLRLRRRRGHRAPVHRHGVGRRAELRGDPQRARAARAGRRGLDPRARPAAGSTTRTATASCTATSSPATCCAAATAARSSSPTSASPRRPSSPTSRRSAPCSAPPPTSRPSRRAASPPARASDLYALGVVAYQLLAGRLPFEAASLTDLARQQDAGAPPLLHELDPAIPRALSPSWRGRWSASPRTASPTPPRWSRRSPTRCAASRRRADRRHARARRRPRRRGCSTAPRSPRRSRARRPRRRAAAGSSRSRSRRGARPPRAGRRGRPPRGRASAPAAAPRALRARCSSLVLLAAVAVGAYLIVTRRRAAAAQVQLKERVQGDVDQAVQEIQDLIATTRARARRRRRSVLGCA